MTPTKTPFAGLERLGPGDSFSSDGFSFQDRDRAIIDYFLRLAATQHRHDAHVALATPAALPIVEINAGAGQIPADTSITVAYTAIDAWGGETLPIEAAAVQTPAGLADPDDAPTLALDTTAGQLVAAVYDYALTITDGQGGETVVGPEAELVIDSGSATNRIVISGLQAIVQASGGSGWRLWRIINGGEWTLIATGTVEDTYTDDGTGTADCGVQPPTVTGTTLASSQLQVTVPGLPNGSTGFNVYATTTGDYDTASLLGSYAPASVNQALTFDTLAFLDGMPPAQPTAVAGAPKILATRDIDWTGYVAPGGGGGGGGGGGPALPGYPSDHVFTPSANPPMRPASYYPGFQEFVTTNETVLFEPRAYPPPPDWEADHVANTASYGGDHFGLENDRIQGDGTVTVRFRLTANDPSNMIVLAESHIQPGEARLAGAYQFQGAQTLDIALVTPDGNYNSIFQLASVAQPSTADMPTPDTDMWLRLTVSAFDLTVSLFTADPATNQPILAGTVSVTDIPSERDIIRTVAYGGLTGFGWQNNGGPADAVRIFDVTTHSENAGLIPPVERPGTKDPTALTAALYGDRVQWITPDGAAGLSLQAQPSPYGAVQQKSDITFPDPSVLYSPELQFQGGPVAVVGGLFRGVGRYDAPSLKFLPGGYEEVWGDFVWTVKVTRTQPDVGQVRLTIQELNSNYTYFADDIPTGGSENGGVSGPALALIRTDWSNPVSHTDPSGPATGDSWLVVRRVGAAWTLERWTTDPAVGGNTPAESVTDAAWGTGPVRLQVQMVSNTVDNAGNLLAGLAELIFAVQSLDLVLMGSTDVAGVYTERQIFP